MNNRCSLLVVDDIPDNIIVLREILGTDYSIKVANSGQLALEIAAAQHPDLILLDVMMPGMNGYDVCIQLKKNAATRNIPVIFVTSLSEVWDEARGFESGAADYITKPVSPPIVRARVSAHLALADQRRHLEQLVAERTSELEHSYRQLEKSNLQLEHSNQKLEQAHLIMLEQLGRAADYRDNETGKHIVRVGNFSKLLALASGFTDSKAELLMYASMMHDTGKIGIPDSILLKQGKLTAEEFEVIKMHPQIGAEIIGDHDVEVLKIAREIALTHHEKWNGQGYPHGLCGDAIPIAGRIVAIVDVFDALTCKRPYKIAWPIERAFEQIEKESGQHFDPELARLFLGMKTEVWQVVSEYSDEVDS